MTYQPKAPKMPTDWDRPRPIARGTHYPNMLPPVPWIVRGDHAMLVFCLICAAAFGLALLASL